MGGNLREVEETQKNMKVRKNICEFVEAFEVNSKKDYTNMPILILKLFMKSPGKQCIIE